MHRTVGLAALLSSPLAVPAQDWPMYRADAARSAYTTNRLPADLTLRWQRTPALAPNPAWPQRERMTYDRAFQPVVVGRRLFYGSSADGAVRALDTRTGAELWVFHTEAPVRFAPAVDGDRVMVASDDGHLYCLQAATGALLWHKRGGPDHRRVLGNGSMISRWPARGGPVVRDGVVYFAAGIWQSEGVYIYALDARTGEVRWVNDDAGQLFLPQPHGGANARSGVSAQGHLVATDELLLVPTGRAVPAAFDLRTGAFRYYHLQQNGHRGGTATMASGKYFFNSGVFFDAKTGAAQGRTGAAAIAGLPDGVVTTTRKGVVVYRWTTATEQDKAGKTRQVRKLSPVFRVPRVLADTAVVVAHDAVVTGGKGVVSRIGLRPRRETFRQRVDGTVYGLVVADDRLFVSTDSGAIYCFGAGDGAARTVAVAPAAAPPVDAAVQQAAAAILARGGIRAGYCVDLGCGDGALTQALLQGSDLQVIAIDADPEQVRKARQRLTRAGLYGTRVLVHHGRPDRTGFPGWFANLVVSGRSVSGGAVPMAEAARLQRPHGGVVCVGRPDALRRTVRGALPGEGSWTHQYADPANTVCSDDPVHGPLEVLWFADVVQRLTQRHGRGPAPLYRDGRLFSLGLHSLIAVDAYNGRVLWQHPFPDILTAYHGDHLMGTAGTNSVYCMGDHGIFVRQDDRCLRIDPATGRQLGAFEAPPARDGGKSIWGFIATDGDLLFGSLADPGHVVTYRYVKGGDMTRQLTESKTLFALDARTGALVWRYDAEHSIRHNAIAIGDGSVFLIDRPLAELDQLTRAMKRDLKKARQKLPVHLPGALLALDAATGSKRWETTDDIFGTVLAASVPHQALLMSYQPTRFRLDSEVGGRLAVFDLRTGKRRWQKQAAYQSRPVLNGSTVYAQGGAWHLLDGADRKFDFQRSYGCGILASGRRTMVYRSATLGYFDLEKQTGNEDFGGVRPGCWINAIPAGGMVLVPDGSAGCRCSYQNKTWLALRPREQAR